MTVRTFRQSALEWLRSHPGLRDVVFLAQNGASRVAPSQAPRHADCEYAFTLSALVRVKDEARFLPEWLAYHHILGVEHFYIYDNGSTDGTARSLTPFVERGLITLVSWPSSPVSPGAELHFLRNLSQQTEWLAFLDADEYLVERTPGGLSALLAQSEGYPAVALNWRYFGSSYHEEVPPGLILENFTAANAELNRHIKVIARTSQIHRIRNSHNFYYRSGKLARTPDGQRVMASFSNPGHAENAPVTINHYVYRSRADALRKVHRGFVDRQGQLDTSRRESQVAVDFGKNNDVTVTPSPEVLRAVKALLRELGYPRELVE